MARIHVTCATPQLFQNLKKLLRMSSSISGGKLESDDTITVKDPVRLARTLGVYECRVTQELAGSRRRRARRRRRR